MNALMKSLIIGAVVGAVVQWIRTNTVHGIAKGAAVGAGVALLPVILLELKRMRTAGKIPSFMSDDMLSGLAHEIRDYIERHPEVLRKA